MKRIQVREDATSDLVVYTWDMICGENGWMRNGTERRCDTAGCVEQIFPQVHARYGIYGIRDDVAGEQ